ncbi:MAG: TrmH family RNA methyltransferase, partial [Burkholderiales bacterium]
MPELSEVKYIRSRDNPLLIELRKQIKNPAAYRKTGRVWLEGEHLCEVAAYQQSLRVSHALISETGWQDPRLGALARSANTVLVLGDSLMASLSSLESPASLGFMTSLPTHHKLNESMATVILDRLQDPGNVGTILRSAAAFGFQQIVAIKGTVALWSPKVLRAGMGAHFSLRLLELLDSESLGHL